MTALRGLPRLDPADMHVGAHPKVLRAEIEAILVAAQANSPRSQQRLIGPSELGTPCPRRLAYRLSDAPRHNIRDTWRATVGTGTHAWIAEALAQWNAEHYEELGFSRYLIEMSVPVGEIDDQVITGSADCYDRVTAEVIDWKIVGTTTLRAMKRAGPEGIAKQGYRVQAHLYGYGFTTLGVPVNAVNIAYLPSSGELREAVWQREQYDESVATQAIARADAIWKSMAAAGAPVLIAGLPRVDDLCQWCPYYNPVIEDATKVWDGCPGARPSRDDLSDLLGA